MLLVCPSCATSYDLDPGKLGANGRQVRCVRCHIVWRAQLSHADKLKAAAEALSASSSDLAIGVAAAEEAVIAAGGGGPASEPAWTPAADGEPAGRSFEMVPETSADGAGPEATISTDSETAPGAADAIEAPPIAPADLDIERPTIDVDHGRLASQSLEDIETFAARRAPRGATRRRRLPSPSLLQAAILALLIVDSILIGWRKDIVRILPQTASLYAAMWLPVNLRGLTFDGVATSMETREAVPILVVQGNVVNASGAATDVPRLKLIMRNAAKQEIYSWTTAPPLPMLQPYQAVGFRTRLASPPAGSHDVLVRFVTRRDVIAGAN
jgi:predicted Zn finger-like uncharacterized protein